MSLERELRQEIRKTKIQQAILGTLAIAGVLSVGALAPNVVGAYGKLFGSKRPRADNIQSAARRLTAKGFIIFEKRESRVFLTLTKKGERYLQLASTLDFKIKKPKRWDKKWRVVIFDIPEKRKRLRELLRNALVRIGFVRLQDSVWAYPYDCEEFVTLLKADFRVGKDVLYMIVDKVENDRFLRSHFGL